MYIPGISQKGSPVGREATGPAVHAAAVGSSLPPNSVLKLAKKFNQTKKYNLEV